MSLPKPRIFSFTVGETPHGNSLRVEGLVAGSFSVTNIPNAAIYPAEKELADSVIEMMGNGARREDVAAFIARSLNNNITEAST